MMKALKKKRKGGFTLIELIVVIAILGILAAIAIPRLVGFQDDAKEKAVLAEAKTIASTISVLAAQNYTFTATDGVDATAKVYSNSEVLGYAGINSGGTLTITGTAPTSFTWSKQFGTEYFTVTYTYATDTFNAAIPKTTGTLTNTAIDTTFE